MSERIQVGERVTGDSVRSLAKKANGIFRGLKSRTMDRNTKTPWAEARLFIRITGLAVSVAITWSLLVAANLSMASILSPPFSWTDTEKNEKMLGTVWLELYGPDELSSDYSLDYAGERYHRLRITFPPVTKKGYRGDFQVDSWWVPKGGRGMFLDLSKPGLIMLAIEDDKAYFSQSQQEVYYKEVERGKVLTSDPDWIAKDIKKTYTGADKFGSQYTPSTPTETGVIKTSKFLMKLVAMPLGFDLFIEATEKMREFIEKEAKKNPRFWALTTQVRPSAGTENDSYKSSSLVFSDDVTYDLQRTAWVRLSGTETEALGYGIWGYEINYLFRIGPSEPEKTRLYIRVLLPYVRIDTKKGFLERTEISKIKKLVELEWEVELPVGKQTERARYQVVKNKVTWEEAQTRCQQMGGHLVTISSKKENSMVARLLWDNAARTAWIGLTDKDQEDKWKWVADDSSTYTNWAPGEPNDAGGAEDCVQIYSGNGRWNDWGMPNNPDNKDLYVCESEPKEPEEEAKAPSAPASLNGTAACFRRIDLTWKDESTNEEGFHVDRKTGNDYTRTASLPADTTSYTDAGLEPETTYWYRVTAYNKAGKSSSSSEVNVTTPAVPAQAKLTLGSALDDGDGNVSSYRVHVELNGHLIYSGCPGVGTSPIEHGRHGKKADSGFQNLKNLEILFDRKLLGGAKNNLEVTLSGVDRTHCFCWESLAVDCIELPYEHYKHRHRIHDTTYRSWVHGGETYWSAFTLPQK